MAEMNSGVTKLTFKRYEKKYLLSAETHARLRERLDDRIEPDLYFASTVCSVYYDDDSYKLIRRSVDGPVYKEKLRLRSYNVPGPEDPVFVELKKKYKGIVYKRRVSMTAAQAEAYLAGEAPAPEDNQMIREIDWFMKLYEPKPRAFIACDRTAYVAKDEPELRITFDKDIRWRQDELRLTAGSHGELLTQPGMVLMEVKLPGVTPLWLARMFSELGISPTGISKYGICYKENLLKDYINGVILNA